MVDIFASFLFTSAVGSLIALLLLAIKPLTVKCLPYTWHYFTWLVVLIIMVLPIRIDIPPLSYLGLSNENAILIEEDILQNITATEVVIQRPSAIFNSTDISPLYDFLLELWHKGASVFAYVWLGIAFLSLISRLGCYGYFLYNVRQCSDIASCSHLGNYTSRLVEVRKSDTFGSPILVGVFKPTLLLPKDNLTQTQLSNVLAHEMIHLKRHDLLYKWFACIVKCLHWFNPMVYFVSKQIDRDCEISCDLAVVKDMSVRETEEYIETILTLLSRANSKIVPLTTGMTGSKKILMTRFTMIKNRKMISKKAYVSSGIIAFVILTVGLLSSGVFASSILENEPDALSFIWPTESQKVSNPFGTRVHPIIGDTYTHNGIDIIAQEGAEVYASIDGIVLNVGYNNANGKYIVIENVTGVITQYLHLSSIEVTEGSSVKQGEIIGRVGKTGAVTGPHLHFSIQMEGKYCDPVLLMK